jgi:hypothetical protein
MLISRETACGLLRYLPDGFKAESPSAMFCQDGSQVIVQGYELTYSGCPARC